MKLRERRETKRGGGDRTERTRGEIDGENAETERDELTKDGGDAAMASSMKGGDATETLRW